jgi:hypothetical protein
MIRIAAHAGDKSSKFRIYENCRNRLSESAPTRPVAGPPPAAAPDVSGHPPRKTKKRICYCGSGRFGRAFNRCRRINFDESAGFIANSYALLVKE